MVFVCVAKQPPAPDVNIAHSNGRWDCLFQIGYDPDGPYTYYMSVHTYPSKDSLTEFAFCIAGVDNLKRTHHHTYQSSVVRKIIPKQCKAAIAALLYYHTRELLSVSKPSEFFMETFELNLPAAAVSKYDALCHIFQALGYSVTSTPTTPGKLMWTMKL